MDNLRIFEINKNVTNKELFSKNVIFEDENINTPNSNAPYSIFLGNNKLGDKVESYFNIGVSSENIVTSVGTDIFTKNISYKSIDDFTYSDATITYIGRTILPGCGIRISFDYKVFYDKDKNTLQIGEFDLNKVKIYRVLNNCYFVFDNYMSFVGVIISDILIFDRRTQQY